MVYFGFFYLLLGTIFLFLPLISIEFGRPRDLMKSALYLVIGVTLITKNNFHDNLFIPYMFCVSLLISFHVLEIFSFRFNLLTSQEKNKLSSLVEIKKNISKFLHAVSLVFKNFSKSNFLKFDTNKESIPNKKWVRNNSDDLLSSKKDLITLEMKKKETMQPEKDIIEEEKF